MRNRNSRKIASHSVLTFLGLIIILSFGCGNGPSMMIGISGKDVYFSLQPHPVEVQSINSLEYIINFPDRPAISQCQRIYKPFSVALFFHKSHITDTVRAVVQPAFPIPTTSLGSKTFELRKADFLEDDYCHEFLPFYIPDDWLDMEKRSVRIIFNNITPRALGTINAGGTMVSINADIGGDDDEVFKVRKFRNGRKKLKLIAKRERKKPGKKVPTHLKD